MSKYSGRSKKIPEQKDSEKLEHYKSINRQLKKRLTELEKRVVTLERKFAELDQSSAKYKEKKTKDFKKQFNERFNPSYKEKE